MLNAANKTDNNAPAEKTVEEKNFEEQQEIRQSKVKKFRKRLKWYHILIAVFVLAIISLFVIWHFIPQKVLNVALLDKTVLSYSEDDDIIKDNVYRKHRGFTWLLNQQHFVKPDGTSFNYKTDYFGPMLDEEGNYDHSVELTDADSKPDFVYLADAYGLGNDTFGHYNGSNPLNGGFNDDDMSYINFAYESGAPIVAEATLFSSPLSDSVRSQLTSMLGVTPTKWIGRYLVDLEDFTDVPDWAPPMYEQQEGVEWRFTGPGILLVSEEGKIIILEQNTDFSSKDLLKIYINEDYKKEFGGCDLCNFYNWFELIEPSYGTENIATFEFDLNATGMEKIKEISKTPRFCAIARRQEKGYAPVYYLAGDCNDYVNGERYGNFVFANEFFKFLSYDRQGDISNFFWRFYNPFIRKILSDTKANEYVEESQEHTEVSRVNNGSFQILEKENWKNLSIKAVSINADEPGKEKYSRDFTYYKSLISNASELGVNCIEAKELLPPEFYTAVSRHNKNPENRKIYIIQRVKKPEDLKDSDYLSKEGLDKWKKSVQTVVDALHGNVSTETKKTGKVSYFIDVSDCVLCVTVDPELTADKIKNIKGISSYSYSGKYVDDSTGINGFAAFLYDAAQSVSNENYGYCTPVSVSSELNMIKGLSFVKNSDAYIPEDYVSSDYEQYTFSNVLLDNEQIDSAGGNSGSAQSSYGSVMSELAKNVSNVLVSGISFSNVNAGYGQDAVTEEEQGSSIVDALNAVKDSHLLGGVVYDLNDTWSNVSEDMAKFTTSDSTGCLWHNTCDSAQMTGLLALDSVMSETPGLVLSDDDLVQAVSMNSDEAYMYITLQLFEELNYKDNVLFVGIDTYQRNDGEYYYAKDFTPNSLSGMEFTIRFEDKQKAAFYVTRSYDRARGSALSKESYTGEYDKVADLVYGGFTSCDTQFYQTGSTVNIRLPWTWLNVFDPAKKLVISDPSLDKSQAKTVTTKGPLVSVMIGERKEGDLIYGFPVDKHDPGYKVYDWSKWEKANYTIRQKEGFEIVKRYFSSN